MDLSNLVSIQIKLKLLQVDMFAYIHFHANGLYPWRLNYSTKMWHGKFMDAIHMVQNVY